jgi:hypothetical protein
VTLECRVKVGIRPLRQAITAVTPHAEPTKTKDEISSQSRVRLIAAKDELLVIATCTDTTAMAAVAIEEDSRKERFAADDGVFAIDLPPGICRAVLADFKGSRSAADGIQEWVSIDFGVKDEAGIECIRITDQSALFPGLKLEIPTLPLATDFPDVIAIMARAFEAAAGDVKPLVVKGTMLGLFRPASETYAEPLQFRPTGGADARGYLVQCGPMFAGLISSRHNDDDSLKRRDKDHRRHLARLGLGADLKSVI